MDDVTGEGEIPTVTGDLEGLEQEERRPEGARVERVVRHLAPRPGPCLCHDLVFEPKGGVEEPVREPGVGEGEQASEAGGGRVTAVRALGDEVGEVVGEEAVGHGCCCSAVRASPLRGV